MIVYMCIMIVYRAHTLPIGTVNAKPIQRIHHCDFHWDLVSADDATLCAVVLTCLIQFTVDVSDKIDLEQMLL